MRSLTASLVVGLVVTLSVESAGTTAVAAQQAPAGVTPPATQGARGGGRGAPPAPVNTLGAGPWILERDAVACT